MKEQPKQVLEQHADMFCFLTTYFFAIMIITPNLQPDPDINIGN